ncbi:MAG: mechanosensitive ion channel [Proteobacteria bacterium]|nr:mechanosensitive ion channel [Pseudomonadota bacterium]
MDLMDWHRWVTEQRVDEAVTFALNLVIAVVIMLVALVVSGWLRKRIVDVAADHPRADPTLFGFLGSLSKYAVLGLAAVVVLNRFGIQTASLVALIGAAGLAIGLALQGTLSNLAAGVMLVIFRPIRAGDYVDAAGASGTVRIISLFFTELTSADNLQVIVPNGQIWASTIVNYSMNQTRRLGLSFSVPYGSDLKAVDAILAKVIAAEPRIHPKPVPVVKLSALAGDTVSFAVRAWVARTDWWPVSCDLIRAAKEAFDTAGITSASSAIPKVPPGDDGTATG